MGKEWAQGRVGGRLGLPRAVLQRSALDCAAPKTVTPRSEGRSPHLPVIECMRNKKRHLLNWPKALSTLPPLQGITFGVTQACLCLVGTPS